MAKNIIYRQCFRTKKCTFVLEANLYGAEMEFETLKRKGKFLLLDEGVALRRIPVGLPEQEEQLFFGYIRKASICHCQHFIRFVCLPTSLDQEVYGRTF